VRDLNLDRVLFVGDVHGSTRQIARALDVIDGTDTNVLVQLGDFGIWPGSGGALFLREVNELLEETDTTLFFVDGNHEDFDQIAYKPIDPSTGLQPWGPRLFRMPRGYRADWNGVKIGALGGAHSVDRKWRLEESPEHHWEAEHVTEEEAQLFRNGGPVDVIFMHDSPAGAPNAVVDDPHNPGASIFPQEELYLAAQHRALLATAVNPTSPALIAHGHYHHVMAGRYTPEGATRECSVIGLDEGRARRISDFVCLIDLQQFKEKDTSL
jgi:predicted phosphodiesterase